VLPDVVAAVGSEVQILLDGGVRRGSDVVRAVALGATAVLVGRPYIWGLAAAGEEGVVRVLDLLSLGIQRTLHAIGRESIAAVDSTCVKVA
jgi:isopentenyl diphosphate isomerase/L-lactate dehydrogenase-like FMN-dependent dehydrogenase